MGAEVPVPEQSFGAPAINVTKIENGEATLEMRRDDGSRSTITLLSAEGGLQLDAYYLTVTVQGKRAVLRITKADAPSR
ncbi:hypothetical protein [Streptomyces albicerus]|uniref:hypothetical protein n=1 Tax=Streptomyces albicerus TaxID=2569859 RepID=UPI00124BBA28|nr:hypothetical protein [Streptomyces albicerus]